MNPDSPLLEAAEAMAKRLTPEGVRKLRPLGLNRKNSRRMAKLARQQKLTVHDIPAWLVINVLAYGAAE